MHCFPGVSVGFPAGASHFHAKDSWQGINWVLWSQGDLRIDGASFGIIFSPAGCAAKPFGCLTSAVIVACGEPGSFSTFVATTNDPVHNLLRLSFQSPADEEAFVAIAQAAEASGAGRFPGGAGGSRPSLGTSRRSNVRPSLGGDSLSEECKRHICERHPGAWPLIFGGAELCGADPHGDPGSEVLLGRGALVILDSQDAARVGLYELLFYDEGLAAPVFRLPIGPRMRMVPQAEPVHDAVRLSAAPRRMSMSLSSGNELSQRAAPRSFSMSVPGGGPWGLSFDHEADAAGFMRDLTVRQRLVAVSLKTSRGWRTVETLQDELAEMRRRGLFATLHRLLHQAVLLLVISLFVYTCFLYGSDPEQPLLDVAVAALGDAGAAAAATGSWAADAGMVACGLIARAVPAVDVQRCVALPEATEVRSCAAALVGVSAWS